MTGQQTLNDNQPKPFVLRRRNRVLVETTQGRFFARYIVTSDLPKFSKYLNSGNATEPNYEELGKFFVMHLVCVDESRESSPALTEESFTALTDTDLAVLVKAVSQACELFPAPEADTLHALGQAVFTYLSTLAKQEDESRLAIRQIIETNFGSLSSTVQAALGDRFSALSATRSALGTSAAVQAARSLHEGLNSSIGGAVAGGPRAGEAIALPTRRFVADIEPFRPPKFEETAAGRTATRAATASEKSAKQLSEVAGLIGTMAEQMAALQTTFLSEVLPQWFQNLEDGANATRTTLRQAQSSLFWAKWALVASVLVSILMTGWQVWLAREYKLEDDKQQENIELILKQQLKAAQDLNIQLKNLNVQPREHVQPNKEPQKKSASGTP